MRVESNSARTVGWCALILILALYVVGTVSHGVIRHIVQTLPVWPAVWLGMRRSEWAKWAALPSFIVWLFLMTLIWLFLLGWVRVISGTFSPIEIAMTIVVGLASIVGLAAAFRVRSGVPWLSGIGVFVLMACLQVLALWISFQRGISRDPW
jgi:hypothetical protein